MISLVLNIFFQISESKHQMIQNDAFVKAIIEVGNWKENMLFIQDEPCFNNKNEEKL